MNPFGAIEAAPADPILGLTEQFRNDTRPSKINLTVGVYQNADGVVPVFRSVQKAAEQYAAQWSAAGYLPIRGLDSFTQRVRELNFGNDSRSLTGNRIASIQSPGGTGALRVIAEFLTRCFGKNQHIALSDPTWSNHKKIFSDAGHTLGSYRYLDSSTMQINIEGMLEDLKALPEKSVVLLHACCHNPTGADLPPEHFADVCSIIRERELLTVLDCAYQGFGEGIEEDTALIRYLDENDIPFMLATSLSKNFSLYRQRTGCLSVVCKSEEERDRVLSQLQSTVRGIYSNPPEFGAVLANSVLEDAELRADWEAELAEVRSHIQLARKNLSGVLERCGLRHEHVTTQRGMFSFSGIDPKTVEQLREEFAIYIVGSGRVCLAALHESNIEYFEEALQKCI